MNWVREAISDEHGQADVAYVCIGILTIAAVLTLIYVCTVETIDYMRCQPITTISKGDQSTTSVIPCRFDPLPIGQAAGLIFGAFAALIGGLAGYMAATRRHAELYPPITKDSKCQSGSSPASSPRPSSSRR